MAHRRTTRTQARGRVRPLDTRIEETANKLEKLELQAKIRQLKEKFGRKRR